MITSSHGPITSSTKPVTLNAVPPFEASCVSSEPAASGGTTSPSIVGGATPGFAGLGAPSVIVPDAVRAAGLVGTGRLVVRKGLAVSIVPVTPPSALNTELVTGTPRRILRQCSHRPA